MDELTSVIIAVKVVQTIATYIWRHKLMALTRKLWQKLRRWRAR